MNTQTSIAIKLLHVTQSVTESTNVYTRSALFFLVHWV